MHGIVHRSLKQYVIERAGDDGWDTAVDVAGVETTMYLPVSEYPDDQITAILAAVADLSGHDEAKIQRAFGRYFAPQMLETFDAMVRNDWDAIDVVAALDRLYPEIVSKEGPATDVEVRTRRPETDVVVVEYDSERDLGAFLEGLVHGIAEHYEEDVDVERKSSPHPDIPDATITVQRTVDGEDGEE